MRLTKTPAQYLETRDSRRELPYEAMLACGRSTWSIGDHVRVYRAKTGTGGVVEEPENEAFAIGRPDLRDYDVDHYARLLHETFAARLARAFTPIDYAAVFADPMQLSLFAPPVSLIRTVLNTRSPMS